MYHLILDKSLFCVQIKLVCSSRIAKPTCSKISFHNLLHSRVVDIISSDKNLNEPYEILRILLNLKESLWNLKESYETGIQVP